MPTEKRVPRRVSFITDLTSGVAAGLLGFVGLPPNEILEFDATISEIHSGDVDITSYPVERNADMTDHVRRRPEELAINVIVTNHPIIVEASKNAKPVIAGGDPKQRAEEAYFTLRRWKNEGKLIRVVTRLRDYQQMVISSLSVSRDKDTGNMINAAITLREINIAITEIVNAPEPKKTTDRTKTNLGKKPKIPVAAGGETENKLKSTSRLGKRKKSLLSSGADEFL